MVKIYSPGEEFGIILNVRYGLSLITINKLAPHPSVEMISVTAIRLKLSSYFSSLLSLHYNGTVTIYISRFL